MASSELPTSIVVALTPARQSLGLSVADLARRLETSTGVSAQRWETRLSWYESGERDPGTLAVLRIAEELDVSIQLAQESIEVVKY